MRTLLKHLLFLLSIPGLNCIQLPQTTRFNPALPSISIGDYAFHAETFGSSENPPLIIIHGGPGGDYNYLLGIKEMADDYHILFYDQRGSGLSPREDKPSSSIDSFLQDLDWFVDHHGKGKKVRLVGHSWGGMIVTAYLGKHGNKVSHAVIAEPGMLHPESSQAMITALKKSQSIWQKISMLPVILQAAFVKTEDNHERMDFVVTKFMGSASGQPYQCEGENFSPDTFIRAGYAVMQATVIPLMDNSSAFIEDYTKGLKEYSGRTLLLSSSCSFIGYEFQERYHRNRFPENTEHKVIRQTGHNMFTLKPVESLNVVRDFLR